MVLAKWRRDNVDSKTREALQASIDEKWQPIVDGAGRDYGSINCPLKDRLEDPDEPE
jgi:hypothetical protein